jgi:hypothetical protein
MFDDENYDFRNDRQLAETLADELPETAKALGWRQDDDYRPPCGTIADELPNTAKALGWT